MLVSGTTKEFIVWQYEMICVVASTFAGTDGLFITLATLLIAHVMSSVSYSLPEWSEKMGTSAVANQRGA